MIDDEPRGHSPGGHASVEGEEPRTVPTRDDRGIKETGMSQGEDFGRDQPNSAVSEAEAKREKRRRLRMLERIFEALGIEDEDALALTRVLNDLLPPEHRMSTGAHLAERLEKALIDDDKARSKLLFKSSGEAPLDITSERSFRDNEQLAKLLDNEEGLFRALILNERVRVGLSRQLAEHDGANRMILAELVRRYTHNEQWRHMLPKYVLPVFSVLHEAKIHRDDLRPGNKLLDRIIDAVCDYKKGAVSRETLVAAAKRTEDQFERILAPSDDLQVDTASPEKPKSEPACEPFHKTRMRLQRQMLIASGRIPVRAGEALENTDEQVEELNSTLRTLWDWEAGLDEHQRPVFGSVTHFAEREKLFRDGHLDGQ